MVKRTIQMEELVNSVLFNPSLKLGLKCSVWWLGNYLYLTAKNISQSRSEY